MIESALEKHAGEVAKDVLGDNHQGPQEIITLIISIFTTIAELCPLPLAQVREAVKKPTIRQRAASLKTTMDICRCCGKSELAFAIHRSMISRGPNMADADIDALVNEARSDSNLLV